MEEIINQAKADYLQAKKRVEHALSTTPDERINWSPSPTARTPIELVAHIGMVTSTFTKVLGGAPLDAKSTEAADRMVREAEKSFTTRAQALEVLNNSACEYLAFVDALTPEKYAAVVETSFFTMPTPAFMAVIVSHMSSHCAQIAYIQTIYGDRDWHMGK